MNHARTIEYDYVKILAIYYKLRLNLVSDRSKMKGELMHENGFEFEANLKHYQPAVSLMTSLAYSTRI